MDQPQTPPIHGLTGRVTQIQTACAAADQIAPLAAAPAPADLDLRNMAEWALNYLTRTPRPGLGYQPVFQCHPLRCPPTPVDQDPVVACDTDARMDWEWYYMRDVAGSARGAEVEAAFHQRLRSYVDAEGRVWAAPGCYNEGDIHARYERKDYVLHTWGATKILQSLSLDFTRTRDPASADLAQKVMAQLKQMATWDQERRCWFRCGMGALSPEGEVIPNFWNQQPAPVVEPLVTYHLATGDPEALDFARAYAEGMLQNLQPRGIRFAADGSFAEPLGHSHATMHAVWGVAHLGLVTGEARYLDFAARAWNWMLSRGTGTGWFPAMPDSCNETCCVSDMISIAACLGRGGQPAYYDYVERYLRNYISNLQFIVTPQFEEYYRRLNQEAGEAQLERGLEELRKFQGGIIGGSGLNDWENELLGGVSGFEMFGCCAPEGMRAIHTAWAHTIEQRPTGVYVNLSLNRDSPWGRVISFMPSQGRLSVQAGVQNDFFLRPPHWAPREQVRAFVGTQPVPVVWAGDHVSFAAQRGQELTLTYPLLRFDHEVKGLWPKAAPELKMRFAWLGNMVVGTVPAPGKTPLFTGAPRLLPPCPPSG
ncbi:MAG: hypothetical protein HYW07_09425 [Candidatus Latescibacteria bacterium]|nr:hypothetical protein [Candidatus Latescibacterota bacterium]